MIHKWDMFGAPHKHCCGPRARFDKRCGLKCACRVRDSAAEPVPVEFPRGNIPTHDETKPKQQRWDKLLEMLICAYTPAQCYNIHCIQKDDTPIGLSRNRVRFVPPGLMYGQSTPTPLFCFASARSSSANRAVWQQLVL